MILLLVIMMILYDTLLGHMIILYDTLADDGFHLNNPLSRGMESMIVSRTKVDHCLKNCNNDDVDGEYDMIMVIMCRLRILRRMLGTG